MVHMNTVRNMSCTCCAQDAPSWDNMGPAEKAARAFLTMEAAFGAAAAWDYWTTLATNVM